jgi:hypothetical protein
MAEKWNAYPPRPASRPPRQAPETITAIARRYYSCAVALSTVMGLPLTERFLQEHHAAIACTFIESGRAGVRLPGSVSLPPLATTTGQAGEPTPKPDSQEKVAEVLGVSQPTVSQASPPEGSPNGHTPSPTAIPQGLPCSGVLLVDLKPAQLSLLIGKLEHLAEAKGSPWTTLLQALEAERQARVARGRKRPVLAPVPDPARDGAEGRGVDG